jgi:hypothetical protein
MITKILGLLVVLAIVGFLVYRLLDYYRNYQPEDKDEDIIDKVDTPCPTGWVHLSDKGGKNVCQNRFRVPVNDNSCYNNGLNRSFIKINDINNSDDSGLKDRCGWIKRCGINGTYAPWIGVADKC